jgi:hypothetical protein
LGSQIACLKLLSIFVLCGYNVQVCGSESRGVRARRRELVLMSVFLSRVLASFQCFGMFLVIIMKLKRLRVLLGRSILCDTDSHQEVTELLTIKHSKTNESSELIL